MKETGSGEEGSVTSARVTGYSVMRMAYNLLYSTPPEDDQVVLWRLKPGLTQGGGDPIIIGDLTCRNEDCFAGVQVVAYLAVDDIGELGEDDWPIANAVVVDHADTVSDGLYDFAAQAMRAMTAGTHFPPIVPRVTPDYVLDLAEDDDEIRGATGASSGSP